MPVSETLTLLTKARDQASPDLLKLSGLLQTVGEQADRLDPMWITVRVNDRELRRLQRRLAQTQGQDIVRAGFARRTGGAGRGRNTIEGSVADRLASNISDLESTFDDITPSTGTAVTGAGAALLAGAIASGGGGGGGGGSRRATGEVAAQFARESSIPDSQILQRMFSPAAAAQGEAPFVQPTDFLGDEFPSQAFMQALRTDMLADDLDLESAFELPTVSRSQLIDFMDDLDSLEEVSSILDLQDTKYFEDAVFRRQKLASSLTDLRVGMTEFYDILAALVPILFTFLGTIPLVIGGLAGLAAAAVGAAGALGAVAGLGLLGAAIEEAGGGVPGLEDIADVFDGLREDFVEAFADPAEQLAPLFRDGVDALSRLFDRLGAVAGMLPGMSEQFRAVGRFVEDFLVSGFQNLLQLADAASPIFARIGEFLSDVNLTQGFAEVLEMALPLLVHLSSLLVAGIDDLLLFSEGMAKVLIVTTQLISTMLSFITSVLETVVPLVNDGSRALGVLVGTLLTLTSAVLLASRAFSIYAGVSQFLAGKTLTDMVASLKASVFGFGASAKGALGAAKSYIVATSAAQALKIAIWGAIGAAIAGAAVLSGVLGVVGSLAAGFLGLGTDIDDATSSLEEFQRQQDSLRSGSGAFVGALDREVYVDYSVENRNNYQGMDMEDMQFATVRGTDSFDPNSRNDDTYDSAL